MVQDANCDDVRDRFEAREFKHEDQSLLYRLLRPKNYDAAKKYPLVVFFHGGGENAATTIKSNLSTAWLILPLMM